jgi:hypothetical protein
MSMPADPDGGSVKKESNKAMVAPSGTNELLQLPELSHSLLDAPTQDSVVAKDLAKELASVVAMARAKTDLREGLRVFISIDLYLRNCLTSIFGRWLKSHFRGDRISELICEF